MSYRSNVDNWEGLAKEDALWAILTDPDKKGGAWNEEAFFKTGEIEIENLFDYLSSQQFIPDLNTAMDFGCGVGRISRALYPKFSKIIGIDASETMIDQAKKLNQAFSDKISFLLNKAPDLSILPDNSISFIYCTIVLQHIPTSNSLKFISEFTRILSPGGILVFQLPIKDIRNISTLRRIREKLKIRERLAGLGFMTKPQMEMNVFEEKEILSLLNKEGCEVLDAAYTNHTSPSFNGALEFIKEDESIDFVSRMFVVQK